GRTRPGSAQGNVPSGLESQADTSQQPGCTRLPAQDRHPEPVRLRTRIPGPGRTSRHRMDSAADERMPGPALGQSATAPMRPLHPLSAQRDRRGPMQAVPYHLRPGGSGMSEVIPDEVMAEDDPSAVLTYIEVRGRKYSTKHVRN